MLIKILKLGFIVMLSLLFNCHFLFGQEDSNFHHFDSIKLNVDTLYFNSIKIFIGQKLIVGKGSGENSWYRTIDFKNGFNFPLLFLRDLEIKQNLKYQADPSVRNKDKVKEYLKPGYNLTVLKIKKVGPNYIALLRNDERFSINYKSLIVEAIKCNELLLN